MSTEGDSDWGSRRMLLIVGISLQASESSFAFGLLWTSYMA